MFKKGEGIKQGMQKSTYTWKNIGTAGIILMVIFGLLCIPFYSVIDDGYFYGKLLTRQKQLALEEENTIDCFFVGDSEVWASYAPLQFYHEQGFTSYNLGTVGLWAGDLPTVMKYSLRSQHPKLIVLDANCLYTDVVEGNYNFMKVFPLFHFHEYFMNVSWGPVKASSGKGVYLNDTVKAYTGRADYMNTVTNLYPMQKLNEKYLNEFRQICKDENIELLMVNVPTAVNWTLGKEKAVQEWCTANNVPYVDYNTNEKSQEIGLDWSTDTRDAGDHLNVSGSKKFCTSLGELIQEKYSLTDHRSDSAYAQWEKNYQKVKFYQ